MTNFSRLAWAVTWAALALLAAVQSGAAAPEANFPSKPVKLVVTFAPGGGADILAQSEEVVLGGRGRIGFGRPPDASAEEVVEYDGGSELQPQIPT